MAAFHLIIFLFVIVYGTTYCTLISFNCQSSSSIRNIPIQQDNGISFLIVLQKAKQSIEIVCQSDNEEGKDTTSNIFMKLNISRNGKFLVSVNFSTVESTSNQKTYNASIILDSFLGRSDTDVTPLSTFDFPQYEFTIYYGEVKRNDVRKVSNNVQNNVATIIQVLIVPSVFHSFLLGEGDQQHSKDYSYPLVVKTSPSPCNQLISYRIETTIKAGRGIFL